MSSIKDLEDVRRILHTKITLFIKYVDKLEEGLLTTQGDVKDRIGKAEESLSELEKNHVAIAMNLELEDVDEQFLNDHEEIVEALHIALSKAKARLQPEQTMISQLAPPMSVDMGQVKLPTIELPTFDGSIDKWLSFRDMFSALVHSKPNLPPIQKFLYLKSVLLGPAADVIELIEVTADNYVIAWEKLLKHYKNNIQLVQFYYDKILNLQHVQRESFAELQKVHDVLMNSVQALQSLGRFSERLDFWVISITAKCLDPNSRKEWQMVINKKEIDNIRIKDFFVFLENKSMALRLAYGSMNKNKPNAYSTFTVPVNENCKCCGRVHAMVKCHMFLGFEVQQRHELVKKLKLCYNCLSETHGVMQCRSNLKCSLCNKRHHYLLHRVASNNNIKSQCSVKYNGTEIALADPTFNKKSKVDAILWVD